MKKSRMAEIMISYANRDTGCPYGTKIFTGKDITEASILAANFQSKHPELTKKSCSISR